jgi:hypothetical protein
MRTRIARQASIPALLLQGFDLSRGLRDEEQLRRELVTFIAIR